MIHIGVLSPVAGGFFFGEVLAGIVREVAAAGGHVTLVQTLDAGRRSDEFAPSMAQTRVAWDSIDGFIAIAWATRASYLDELRAAGKPVVMVSNDLGAIDAATVVVDNDEGVRAVVEHLITHGHTRIGFVGNTAQSDMRERHEAYQAAMAMHGLDTTGLFFGTRDHVESGGAGAAAAVAAKHPSCTAVVAATDRVALGLIDGLRHHGVQVPDDLAVVGFDDAEAGWFSSPPLATVRQRFDDLGALASRLLIKEVRGEPVEHRVYAVPAHFIPRKSCGCGPRSIAVSPQGAADARELVATVLDHLGLDATGEPRAGRQVPGDDADLDALDAVITSVLERAYRPTSPPEMLRSLSETYVGMLGDVWVRARDAGKPWAGTLQYCVTRITSALAQLQMVGSLKRINRLSASLDEQYDVGMGLLGRVGTDPSDLSWLNSLSVRVGCLGLWDGTPDCGRLRIAGVFDREGGLDVSVGAVLPVSEFPPRRLLASADAGASEVTYVIPVRGPTGDHGFLSVIGTVDTEFGTGRATYDHWAALLGAALREKSLLEDIRHSEERYAFAVQAANDGLWERDLDSLTMYLSDRCRDLLDVPTGVEVDEADLMAGVHPDDRAALQKALAQAAAHADVPVEVEYRRVRPDGSLCWRLTRALGVAEEGGMVRRLVGSLSDISQRKVLEEQLRHAALYDTVTGLPNRRLFLDRLGWAVEQAQRSDGSRFAVVFLDLDGFKLINDSLGHLMGDELLQAVGERLHRDLRSVDTAARFGGDEFAVLLYGLKQEAVLTIVERLQERIAEPLTLGDHEVSVTASIGIATSDTGYTSAEDVLRDADIAMYHAKEVERGTACLFDPVMHTRATSRLRAQSELRAALVGEQFVVHYQPIVELDGSVLRQFEALVRWDHPERGLLLPADFLPIMAETGTIVVLGQWIIDTVCRQIAGWRRDFHGPFAVSVNLSHREFWSDQLLLTVTQALSRYHVPPRCLILEITESVIMSNPEAARQTMADLHANGIRMHIDDFGTGQSSLHALRAFPVDALKIDQSFVHQLDVDTQTTELVRIIVGMGRTLGLDVVAEGVETNAQADQLRTMGCGTAQGWLYAKALPGDEAGRLLGTALRAHAEQTQRA